jgi:tripartite-type tricarboxylate transporter receptor subunit TctC
LRRAVLLCLCLVAALAGATLSADAQAPDNFYKNRQVRLIIGANTGSSFDSYGRLLAAHLGRHIPGNPTIVPSNMPGASGISSAAFLYSAAPKDGSVIGTFNDNMPLRQVLEPEAVRFDLAGLNWLGAMGNSVATLITWHASSVKTLDDAKTKTVVLGALGNDGGNAVYPLLLNKYLGTRFKLVLGYPGGNTLQLAMERGEIDGRGAVVWSGFKANYPHWIAEKKINVLLQVGLAKDKELPDVPLLIDLAKTPQERAMFQFLSANTSVGFPVVAPPGIPPNRVAILRKAVADTLSDPEFLRDAERQRLPVQFTPGDNVQRVVQGLVSTPADVIDTLKQSLEEQRASAQ